MLKDEIKAGKINLTAIINTHQYVSANLHVSNEPSWLIFSHGDHAGGNNKMVLFSCAVQNTALIALCSYPIRSSRADQLSEARTAKVLPKRRRMERLSRLVTSMWRLYIRPATHKTAYAFLWKTALEKQFSPGIPCFTEVSCMPIVRCGPEADVETCFRLW